MSAGAVVEDRVKGALLGVAIGDALARPFARKPPVDAAALLAQTTTAAPLVHAATTTWTLAVTDALLYRRSREPISRDLAFRLQALTIPFDGRALRGHREGLDATLVEVARRLDRGEDVRVTGIVEPRGEGLACALPFAFAVGDDEDAVASAVAELVALTHRHPEVVAAAGYLVGGARHLLATGEPGEAMLDDARAFARRVLNAYAAAHAGTLPTSISLGEGALAMVDVQARNAEAAEGLLAPSGYDGRDAPMRLAASALLFSRVSEHELSDRVKARLAVGGDADCVLPLWGALFGLRHGADRLPLGFLSRLRTRVLVDGRASALFGARPPALVPLVEDEIRVSTFWDQGEEQDVLELAPAADRRVQLKLL